VTIGRYASRVSMDCGPSHAVRCRTKSAVRPWRWDRRGYDRPRLWHASVSA
jgi:hypothetical protein